MNDLEQLTRRIEDVEAILNKIVRSDRYLFSRNLQLSDGKTIQLGLTTGTKIGTQTTQKIGFYGLTPVTQPTGVAVSAAGIAGALVSLGLIAT